MCRSLATEAEAVCRDPFLGTLMVVPLVLVLVVVRVTTHFLQELVLVVAAVVLQAQVLHTRLAEKVFLVVMVVEQPRPPIGVTLLVEAVAAQVFMEMEAVAVVHTAQDKVETLVLPLAV
jgi:hypothetical protein